MKRKTGLLIALIIIGSFVLAVCADIGIIFIGKQIYPLKYENYVEKYAAEYNVPSSVVYGVIKVESDFDPDAVSSVGAIGLMQMLPDTFSWLSSSEHLDENLPITSLYDPETSIKYGVYYLKYLHEKFQNWDAAIAAYNGGEGNVAEWLENPQYCDKDGNLNTKKIPFPETRNYSHKVSIAKNFYEHTYNK